MADARTEIARLIFLCDERNDAGDFDGVGQLFAHATMGVVGMGDVVCEGAESVAEQYRQAVRVYPEGGARTHHLSTNLIIDIDEESGAATCQSHYVMFQQTDALPLQPIDAGRNRDEFERVDGVWRWKHRAINSMLHGDMSQHLMDVTPFS